MTTLHVSTWHELTVGAVGDDAARVTLAHLRNSPWLAHVGEPSDRDHEVERVGDWSAALGMFAKREDARTLLAFVPNVAGAASSAPGTSTTGTLNAPFWRLLQRIDADPTLYRQTAVAANHALDELIGFRGLTAQAVKSAGLTDPFEAKLAMGDYVTEYIRLLFIEIYAGDAAPTCAYFRDLLGWFLAGLLPCGWDGVWPAGRMRVF